MKQDVWSDASVSDAVKLGYIPVALDVDQPKSAAPAERFGITSIPAVYVVDANGNAIRSSIGYTDTVQMLGLLNASGTESNQRTAASSASCKSCWEFLKHSN